MITIKTEEQLACMRESGRMTGDLLKYIGKSIKVGMTTFELDKLAYEYIKSLGAEPSFLNYAGYPASTCISIDDTVVHGIPSKDAVIKEQLLKQQTLFLIHLQHHLLQKDMKQPQNQQQAILPKSFLLVHLE